MCHSGGAESLKAIRQGGMVEQETRALNCFRCCTEGRGLGRSIGIRWIVGLGDLRGLFQP